MEQGREVGIDCGTAMHHGAEIVAASWRTTDASNSTVNTRDAINYDAAHNRLTITGDDVYRTGQRLGIYSKTEAQSLLRESKRRDNGMKATSRETGDKEPSDEEVEATIESLEKLNRRARAKQGPRAVRDHELRHQPIRTLADINARWRHLFGRMS